MAINNKPLGSMVIEMDLSSAGFTNSMSAVKRAIKSAQIEMKANMAVFDSADDKIGKLQAQYDGLGKQLKINKQHLEELNKAYQDEVKLSGASSTKAQNLANQYNKQVIAVANLERQLDSTRNAMDRVSAEGDNGTKSVGRLRVAFGRLGSKVKDVGGSMSKTITPAIGAMGVAIGKVASDFGTSGAQIENALDLTKEQLEDAKKVAKTLYSEGFGESLDDVTNAIVQVRQNIKGLKDEDLQQVTKSAMTLGKTFDADVNEVTRAGNSLMQNYGLNAKESFDLMAKGAKNGMNFSNEMFDNMSEYTINFKEAGFSAEEMFSILSNGAEKGYNLDRLNDTLLEFKLQSEDSGNAYAGAMKKMSKETQGVFKDYENGKATVSDLYKAVIPDLEKMRKTLPDKEFNTIGKALFGTKWEDQGADVVLSMKTVNKAIEDTDGTMNKMNKTAQKSFGQRFKGVMRSTITAVEPLGETLLDLAEKALPYVTIGIKKFTKWLDNMDDKGKMVTLGIGGIVAALGPAILVLSAVTKPFRLLFKLFDKIPDKGKKAKDGFSLIKKGFDLVKTGGSKAISIVTKLGPVFRKVFTIVSKLAPLLRFGLGAALRFLTGPIGLTITAISLLAAGFRYAYKHSETFRKFVNKLKNGILGAWKTLRKINVREVVKGMFSYITKKFRDGYNSIRNRMSDTKRTVSDTFSNMKKSVQNKVSDMISTVKKMPGRMAAGIRRGAGALKDGAKTMFNGMISGVEWGINKVVSGVNWVLKRVGSESRLPTLELGRYEKGTDGHPGGLALVNDAKGSNYRELIQTPDGNSFIPKERNVVMDLPKGTKVLNGDDTKKLGLIPKYAGGIGALWDKGKALASSAFNKVKDWGSSIWEWVDSKTNITKLLKNKIGNMIPERFNVGITPSLIKGIINKTISKATGWLFDKVDMGGNINYTPTAGVNQWKGLATKALKMTGQFTPGNLSRLLMQMSTESGGNPNAINKWDINALRGTPSKGLMQVIDPTFRAYAMPGYNKNVYDPLSNILASIRYAVSRYGSLTSAYRGVGYANGGIINKQHLAMVGEGNKPEAIIPLDINKRSRALELLAKVSSYLIGDNDTPGKNTGGGDASVALLAKQAEMMQQQVDLLAQLLAKNTDVYMDMRKVSREIKSFQNKEEQRNNRARGINSL